jgi:N-carbamoyl-L-amino-acid hydrolase
MARSGAALSVDADRLWKSLHALGALGDSPAGMERIAFSRADIEARALVSRWLEEAGLVVRVDAAGNLIALRDGAHPNLPPIAIGSHIDTVPLGGKFDGALGVMAALEVVRALRSAGIQTRHPLEVIAFTNEEGGRFHHGLFGSRAMSGQLADADLAVEDDDGVGLAAHLSRVGGDAARLGNAVRAPGSLAAYLELHIEQGPTLYQSGVPIGVVTGITGRAAYRLTIHGFANHAGTTPMDARQDALVAAARLILAIRTIAAAERRCRVATVGVIHARPGAVNVIPGHVILEAELRDVDMERVADGGRRLAERAAEVARDGDVTIEVEAMERTAGAPCAPRLRTAIERAAASLGLATADVESGAGHDAQAIAALTEIGMIFVPSKDGVSHAPSEYSSPEACANGAAVLLRTLLEIDDQAP